MVQPSSPTRDRACPFCERENSAAVPSPNSAEGWKLTRCPRCRFTYLANPVDYEALDKEHAWEVSSVKENQRKRERDPRLHVISGWMKWFRKRVLKRNKLGTLIRAHFSSGNVLDIGCAGGGILKVLPASMVPHGIEISETLYKKAAKVCGKRGGLAVHTDGLSGLRQFQDGMFSGIIMSAYLEHEVQPMAVLRECKRTLRDGGRAIVKVPNYASLSRVVRGKNWPGMRLPEHVNYFTPRSLRGMITNAGLRIERFKLRDRSPISDTLWLVARKDDLPR